MDPEVETCIGNFSAGMPRETAGNTAGAGSGPEGARVLTYSRRVSRGWVRGVRTQLCSSSWSLLYICIKQHRCGYHHYLLIAKNLVSKLPHFIATTWCKGHIFGILSTPIDSPVICLECKEAHLKFHSTSSSESDPSLLFFSAHALYSTICLR